MFEADLTLSDISMGPTSVKLSEYSAQEEGKILSSELRDKMINDTANITNKDALKDKIHDIHNYLRNNGGGYGMSALKVFNLVYGLKKIEENGLLAKVGLEGHPECTFSHLLAMAERGEDEALASTVLNDTLSTIFENKQIKTLLFYEIPQNIRGSVFAYLIKEIDKITAIERTCNVLLSGKIYEYFIGRDESAISELGAYFTDRHIVEYIYGKLDPSLNEDGSSVPSMIDMFLESPPPPSVSPFLAC